MAEESTTLVVADEEELVELINKVKAISEELGIYSNTSKTKVVVIDWCRCLPKFDILKKYEKVPLFTGALLIDYRFI